MPLYRCLIEGENFPAEVDGERELIGFYTTRYVEAENEGEAETVGLDLLRSDEWLQSLRQLISPEDPPAMVHFNEIEQVDDVERSDAGTGFTFFPMNERDKSESECKT